MNNNQQQSKLLRLIQKYPIQQVIAIAVFGTLSGGIPITVPSQAQIPTNPPASEQLPTENKPVQNNRRREQVPVFLENAARQDLSNQLGIPFSQLRVIRSDPRTWQDTCLGLPQASQLCAQTAVEGWRIVLAYERQTWVYRTDTQGQVVRLETPIQRSQTPPEDVIAIVQQTAATQLQRSARDINLVKAEFKTWNDDCLELPGTTQLCTQVVVPGWLVTVSAGQQRLVYRTTQSGSIIRLDEAASHIDTVPLPSIVSDAVLQAAAQKMSAALSQLKVVKSSQIVTDGCLSLPTPIEACSTEPMQAWRVTVTNGQRQLIFHSNLTGTDIRWNPQASQTTEVATLTPTLIPIEQLPPPMGANVLFRATVTGGIAGRTTQTTLMNDGQLIREQLDAKDSQGNPVKPSVSYLSPAQVVKFMQFLADKHFESFDRLNYPAPQGAADYMIMTLSSPAVTTRYADISQKQLPLPLQEIIQAWQQLGKK
ncbi:MAG: hypothetical protein KME16_25450 [Scytolyngbya sp. HA4215-MV1]|jgi:hypothetical protein|nr:hypothetical protein [Scytolyngbya sp. HA4215-MV1]